MDISEKDRSRLREAWTRYCDALRKEGSDIIDGVSGDPATSQELAEALRAVARMGILALQHRMDFADPDFPTFLRTMDDRYKYGGPDAHINYLSATVKGDAIYRLRGNHHNRAFNVNTTMVKTVEVGGESKKAQDLKGIWSRDMKIASDGSFEVLLSSKEQSGDWMKLDPSFNGATDVTDDYPMAGGGLVMRTYYWDPDDGLPPGQFFVERIDEKAPLGPAPLSPERFAGQLESAADLCGKMAKWWIARPGRIRAENTPNQIAPPRKNPPGIQNFTQPFNQPLNYGICTFDLAPDQALYIETEVPETIYWSFQLYNAWWESPDVQHRQTSLSFKQAHLDSDGRFRCVIAHADPGVPNWLDTGSARRGFLFYRWLHPTGGLPSPIGKVVKLKEVRGLMPADHPHIDKAARRAQLSARRAFFAKRFQS